MGASYSLATQLNAAVSTEAIGAYEFDQCGICPKGLTFSEPDDSVGCFSTPALHGPGGAEWNAVEKTGGWPPLLAEANSVAKEASNDDDCCGCKLTTSNHARSPPRIMASHNARSLSCTLTANHTAAHPRLRRRRQNKEGA